MGQAEAHDGSQACKAWPKGSHTRNNSDGQIEAFWDSMLEHSRWCEKTTKSCVSFF